MMAFPRLFQRALLCGLTLVAVGGGLSTLRVRAADIAERDDLVVIVYQVGDLPVWQVSAGMPPQFDASLLVSHIEAIIDRMATQDASIVEYATTQSLVIRQTRANHQRISDMMDRLRADRKAVERKAFARRNASMN